MLLVKKIGGRDDNKLFAMKVVNTIEAVWHGTENAMMIKREREVCSHHLNHNYSANSNLSDISQV